MKNLGIFLVVFAVYTLDAQDCNRDNHSTNRQDSWVSCSPSTNPNPNRNAAHWIRYDLGYVYKLGNTKFWNYNVAGETDKGMKNLSIDFSLDSLTWTEAASFQLAEASGMNTYVGEDGPHLGDVQARYVLVSGSDTWGTGSCAGLSEVLFEVQAVVGLEESLDNSLKMKLYPNPAQNLLKVEAEIPLVEYAIINLAGHEMLRKPFTDTVDISFLASGLYYIRLLSAEQEVFTKKFVKIR